MTDCEYISMVKSTIVRSQRAPWLLPFIRAGNRALSALAPRLAALRAERMFLTPPRPRRPAGERALIAGAQARTVPIGDGSHVETWTWGNGPRVLLVHGWGGRGAQLGAFVEPLVSRGFSVVAFDAPGHGASRRWWRRSAPSPRTTARWAASSRTRSGAWWQPGPCSRASRRAAQCSSGPRPIS